MSHDETSVIATARALGLTVGKSGSAFWLSPCPACGSERRHGNRRDKRGAVGVSTDDVGWRCFSCDASGKVASLIYFAGKGVDRSLLPSAEPAPELPYLDSDDARTFWASCRPARASRQVADWLDATRVGKAACARSLGRLSPAWGRSWASTGHRLILGLHDATGRLRNVLARAVVPAERKSLAAYGIKRSGLVLADRLGVELLRGRYAGTCVITEGERKLLISETLAEGRWATISTGSGMWSAAIAQSCARASRCLVYTDPDEPGARYASAVWRTLPGCELRPEFEIGRERVLLRPGLHEPDDDLHVNGGIPEYARQAVRP